MVKNNQLSQITRAKLKAIKERMFRKMSEEEFYKMRRGSASPSECFQVCRKNIKILSGVAKKLKMNPDVFLALEASLAAVNDAEKLIIYKYCS